MSTVKLGEICTIVSGGTPSRAKPEYWQNGTIPWIKIGDINKKYVDVADEFITEAGLNDSSAKMLSKGTILYTIFATLGEVGILNIDACTNQAIAGITINDSKIVLTDYLYYYLKSKKTFANGIGRGVAQNNINMSILRSFEVPLPCFQEQRAIVDILEKVCTLIDFRKRELQSLDNLIKARFVEMFGDVTINPYGYEQITIGDACDLINGRAFKPSDWGEKGLPIVRIQNLNDTNAPFNYYDGQVSDQHLIDSGMLLFSWSGTPGTSFGAFMWNRGPGALNQHIFKVIPKCDFDLDYLRYAMNGQLTTIIAKAHGGVGLQHITKAELEKVTLLHPDIHEQKQFSAFVSQIDKSKFVVQQALDKAQLLFDSLMQKYFG